LGFGVWGLRRMRSSYCAMSWRSPLASVIASRSCVNTSVRRCGEVLRQRAGGWVGGNQQRGSEGGREGGSEVRANLSKSKGFDSDQSFLQFLVVTGDLQPRGHLYTPDPRPWTLNPWSRVASSRPGGLCKSHVVLKNENARVETRGPLEFKVEG
jgi:hypothetical protein